MLIELAVLAVVSIAIQFYLIVGMIVTMDVLIWHHFRGKSEVVTIGRIIRTALFWLPQLVRHKIRETRRK